jgi:hypothetical protein
MSIVFLTMVGKISFTKKNEKEIKQKGIGIELTFKIKCFHKWTKA